MENYSANEIILGIKNQDNEILNFIYKKFFKEISYFIIKNSGYADDAKDIFQEAIIAIYRRVNEEELTLTCSFKTYLYSVCRLLWLKQLKRRNLESEIFESGEQTEEVVDEDYSEIFDTNEKYALYQRHYSKMAEDCKKILKLFLDNVALKKVATIMGYKSVQYAKKRKFLCKEFLVKSIQSDPKYKELI